ncbi:MAG: hypothetical protein PHO29_14665, partial [Acetobacterium sp.]|nr:hypothetical protein [Acetobacterium sp.]
MDSEPDNMDLWMQETLNSWAEQGTLSLERSAQLQMKITELAHHEKKGRFTRKVWGLVAAITAFIWMLFANCPVAAASYVSSTFQSNAFSQVWEISLLVILMCFLVKHQTRPAMKNMNIEV